jgi:hypothetical protein
MNDPFPVPERNNTLDEILDENSVILNISAKRFAQLPTPRGSRMKIVIAPSSCDDQAGWKSPLNLPRNAASVRKPSARKRSSSVVGAPGEAFYLRPAAHIEVCDEDNIA